VKSDSGALPIFWKRFDSENHCPAVTQVQIGVFSDVGAIPLGGWCVPGPGSVLSSPTLWSLLSSGDGTVTGVFDESYLAALRARNTDVENHLIASFSTPVRVKLRARLRSPEMVEDAFQETFLRIFSYFRSGKTLNNPASLPGFVHTMCHNIALEVLRAHTRQDQLPEHHQGPVDGGLDPQSQLVTEERKVMVRRLLDELPERDGRLLRRVFLDEEDKDTVCREFHVDRGYLRMLLFRARQRFRVAVNREISRKSATVARS
jgi:RNA polymerase sigma factor (sigma-70 family)